jgi:hypothetical protein
MLWHYTVFIQAEKICVDCRINVATDRMFGQKCAVWFSKASRWEPTANRVVGLEEGTIRFGNTIDTFVVGGGLVRFGIDRTAAPVSWQEFNQTGGIAMREACALDSAARKIGADPMNWFCSYDAVPRENWCCIEEISDIVDLVAFRWAKSVRLA